MGRELIFLYWYPSPFSAIVFLTICDRLRMTPFLILRRLTTDALARFAWRLVLVNSVRVAMSNSCSSSTALLDFIASARAIAAAIFAQSAADLSAAISVAA